MKLKLKELLEERGRTRQWLSKKTGIDLNNITRMYNGGNPNGSIAYSTIDRICNALECEPNDLLEVERCVEVEWK